MLQHFFQKKAFTEFVLKDRKYETAWDLNP